MFYLMAVNYLNGAEIQLERILESQARLNALEKNLAAKGESPTGRRRAIARSCLRALVPEPTEGR